MEHLKIKRLELEKRVMNTFNEAQARAIINYKPKNVYEKRIHVLDVTAMDAGARINELLPLSIAELFDCSRCIGVAPP